MKKISAEIVADSVNEHGNRITTFLLTFPRFILAELNTHRMFSRNSASSRAIPFEKMIKMVEEDPFIPIAWQKDHKGMQGNEYFTDESQINSKISCWLNARDHALRSAKYLNSDLVVHKIGDEEFTSFNQFDEDDIADLMAEKRLENTKVTKQLCNRLLEPFMWHTVLLTGTNFRNFFELRCPQYEYKTEIFKSKKDCINSYTHGLGKGFEEDRNYLNSLSDLDWLLINKSQAEIHIQALAEAMWDAMNESTPKTLQSGDWHIPFGDKINDKHFTIFKSNLWKNKQASTNGHNNLIIKIATARAARLSYMNFDGEIDYEKDIQLHDRLLEPSHMSPFEHCARAMSVKEYYSFIKGTIPTQIDKYGITNLEMVPVSSGYPTVGFTELNPTNGDKYGWCNNFRGFIQYRYMIENNIQL